MSDAVEATTASEAAAETAAPAIPEGYIKQDKANAMVASARKKLEAQVATEAAAKAELQEQLEELQATKSGKPDAERQLEKLQAKLKAAQDAAAAAQADALGTKKSMAMANINAQIGWADGIGSKAREDLIAGTFGTLDLDDLTDADTIAPLVSQFRESNPWAVAGSTAAGAGSQPGQAQGTGGVKEYSQAALVELAKTDSAKHASTMKAVWAEVEAGKATLVA